MMNPELILSHKLGLIDKRMPNVTEEESNKWIKLRDKILDWVDHRTSLNEK